MQQYGNDKHSKEEKYDLSEEASKREGGEEATTLARQLERDGSGGNVPVDTPEGDSWGENKVAVSDDD